jgi:hypothetical protein
MIQGSAKRHLRHTAACLLANLLLIGLSGDPAEASRFGRSGFSGNPDTNGGSGGGSA